MNNKATPTDAVSASVVASRSQEASASGGGVFHVQCFGPDGNLKWEDRTHNLVVDQGLQDMNNRYFRASAYTASFFVGLITGPAAGTSFLGTDTMLDHPGWTEFTGYTGTRPAITFGTANYNNPSVVPNASVAYAITTSGTIAGAFLCTVTSGGGGILFSESDFPSPGDRTVQSGDILNVAYTFSLSAS